MLSAAITFYWVVLFIHVAAVVIAFGVLFTYPLIGPLTERRYPSHVPYLHRMQVATGQWVMTPFAIVVLAAGSYMAARGTFDFSDWWVASGVAAIVVLLGIGHAFFIPQARRLAEIADRDIAAAGDGEVALSQEYGSRSVRVAVVGGLANALVLAVIFVMIMGSRGFL